MRTGPRVLPPLVLLAAALTACGATPSATTTPTSTPAPTVASPSSTPTPTPTPSESAATPAAHEVVIDPIGLTIVDADGEPLLTYDWHDEVAATADALDEAFGTPALRTPTEADAHVGPGIRYEWDGMTIFSGPVVKNDTYPNGVWVITIVDAPEVGGLPVRTAAGVKVGMSDAEVIAHGAVPSDEFELVSDRMEIPQPSIPPVPTFVRLTFDQGIVTALRAPSTDGDL